MGLSRYPKDLGTVTVPRFGSETRTWVPDARSDLPKSQIRRQTGEYESLIPPRISGWTPQMDAELNADLEEATLALRDFDRYALTRLGAESPALGPMSAILLRTESASSSQIEKLTTSARQLALAELGETDKLNAQTVVGNVRAMEAALRLADSLDAHSILDMHRQLLRGDPWEADNAGQFREVLVWVGGDDAGPRGAALIAPQPEHVSAAVDDIVRFMNRADIPTLAKTAIAHAHFETTHPFTDGNGRTGRAIAQALLRKDGLTTHTTLPLSAGLLTNTGSYFAALDGYRGGDAGPIVRRFATAARYAARTGSALVNALANELDSARKKLEGVRSDSKTWEVLPALIGQPVINTAFLRERLGLTEPSAHRALSTLTGHGILTERTGRSRNRVWAHSGILSVLDGYAAEVKRAHR